MSGSNRRSRKTGCMAAGLAWGLFLALAALLLACARVRPEPRAVAGLDPVLRRRLEAAWAEAEQAGTAPNARLAAIAHTLLGRPYLAGLEPDPDPDAIGPEESLSCRCDAFDCVTLVETSLAFLHALGAGGLDGMPGRLEAIRYRDGRRDGYASRLHYFTEWLQDNEAKGYLRDLTGELGGEPDLRPVSYMTDHPAAYPALADPEVFRAVRAAELQLTGRPRFRLPRERAAAIAPRLESGDILAFTSSVAGLDVCHVGLAWRVGGEVHVLHATRSGGSVQVTRLPLAAYLAHHAASMTGFRVARPLLPAVRLAIAPGAKVR